MAQSRTHSRSPNPSPISVPYSSSLEVRVGDRVATVRRSERHPEYYLYIEVDEKTFFLGVLENGMTRGDVKRMAAQWITRKYPKKT